MADGGKVDIRLKVNADRELIARSAANRAKAWAASARYREDMARHHARTAELYAYVSAVCMIVAIIAAVAR
jgi:hypothetical protein